jgi:hypothetical protein
MSALRADGVRSGAKQCGQGQCGRWCAQRMRPHDVQMGVYSDNGCTRAAQGERINDDDDDDDDDDWW